MQVNSPHVRNAIRRVFKWAGRETLNELAWPQSSPKPEPGGRLGSWRWSGDQGKPGFFTALPNLLQTQHTRCKMLWKDWGLNLKKEQARIVGQWYPSLCQIQLKIATKYKENRKCSFQNPADPHRRSTSLFDGGGLPSACTSCKTLP